MHTQDNLIDLAITCENYKNSKWLAYLVGNLYNIATKSIR